MSGVLLNENATKDRARAMETRLDPTERQPHRGGHAVEGQVEVVVQEDGQPQVVAQVGQRPLKGQSVLTRVSRSCCGQLDRSRRTPPAVAGGPTGPPGPRTRVRRATQSRPSRGC